ncbi:MAG: hypothetical protein GY854_21990 [Deltaproteobacteria bacterium]|nr:hypothetical protein [Deltaproteobacteria bacterium]
MKRCEYVCIFLALMFCANVSIAASKKVRRKTTKVKRVDKSQPAESQVVEPWAEWGQAAWTATKFAVNTKWRTGAHFRSIIINGPTAVGTPGCLVGPSLTSTIETKMRAEGVPSHIAQKFATAVNSAWKAWESYVTVPGLPWYPNFGAVPAPVAPPTPNVPTPLVVLTSAKYTEVTSQAKLKQRIENALGADASSEAAKTAISAFALTFTQRFLIWSSSVQVTGVLGTGPVPAFSPPYVPVGNVLGGNILPAGSHFMTAIQF